VIDNFRALTGLRGWLVSQAEAVSCQDTGRPSSLYSASSACILLVRGHRVLLDADLAGLYGVETRELVQAVKRNNHALPR